LIASLAKLARRGSRPEAADFVFAQSGQHHSFFKAWKKGLNSYVHLN
jgi:hypothetical protein